jgi:hypothetical protein
MSVYVRCKKVVKECTWEVSVFQCKIHVYSCIDIKHKLKAKAVPLHAMDVLGGRGGIACTHS